MSNKPNRKEILLRAAFDIIRKCNDSHTVICPAETTAFYDGTECDGFCLADDIASELGIESDAEPLTE